MLNIRDLMEDEEMLVRFNTTSSYCNYYFIARDKDISSIDIAGAIEDTLHRIIEASNEEDAEDNIAWILGAVNEETLTAEEVEEMEEHSEYIYIDLGYIIDGLIANVLKVK